MALITYPTTRPRMGSGTVGMYMFLFCFMHESLMLMVTQRFTMYRGIVSMEMY